MRKIEKDIIKDTISITAVGGDGGWWIGVRCEVVVVMALFV